WTSKSRGSMRTSTSPAAKAAPRRSPGATSRMRPVTSAVSCVSTAGRTVPCARTDSVTVLGSPTTPSTGGRSRTGAPRGAPSRCAASTAAISTPPASTTSGSRTRSSALMGPRPSCSWSLSGSESSRAAKILRLRDSWGLPLGPGLASVEPPAEREVQVDTVVEPPPPDVEQRTARHELAPLSREQRRHVGQPARVAVLGERARRLRLLDLGGTVLGLAREPLLRGERRLDLAERVEQRLLERRERRATLGLVPR